MTFPQPSPDAAIQQASDFVRINTTMVSPGDTYQCTQSAKGVQVGPDSDLNQIVLNYWDATIPNTFMNQVNVTPQSPFTGQLYARNDASYQPINNPGAIIVSPGNIVPELLGANAPLSGTQNQLIVLPVMDVIFYLNNPPENIPVQRNDKEYMWIYGQTTALANGILQMCVPLYGRKRYQVTAFDLQGNNGTLTIIGVTYPPGYSGLFSLGIQTTLQTSTAIGNTAPLNKIYTADANGTFDYLIVQLANTSTDMIAIKVFTSDTP